MLTPDDFDADGGLGRAGVGDSALVFTIVRDANRLYCQVGPTGQSSTKHVHVIIIVIVVSIIIIVVLTL